MDKVLYRNFLIFTVLAVLCFTGLSFMLIQSNKAIERSSEWVTHSNKPTAPAFNNLFMDISSLLDRVPTAGRGMPVSAANFNQEPAAQVRFCAGNTPRHKQRHR